MRKFNALFVFLALSALNLQYSTAFAQGSLTPPGAPAPTMKSLAQIEPRIPISSVPFTIAQPGSYYLTTNLIQTVGNNGIVIATNNVTLDLCGFTLVGNGSPFWGVFFSGASNAVVRNGIITGWGLGGIGSVVSINSVIKDLIVSSNGSNGSGGGISMGIKGVTVESCMVEANTGVGITVADNCIVRNCNVSSNSGGGISIGTQGMVEESLANNNGGSGISLNGNGCFASHCSLNNNSGNGISTPDGNRIVDSYFYFNKANGIGDGAFGCYVSGCSFYGNSNGVVLGARSEVINNHFYVCQAAGVFITTNSFGYGGVRIEGNNAMACGVGIQVAGPGNFIIHNTVSGSTANNYVINSNNAVGVIVIPPHSAAISGAVGGAGVGTTDPWANFSY